MLKIRPFSIVAFLFLLSLCGCKEEMEPPPEEDEPPQSQEPAVKPVSIDPRHSISLKADRTISIPNLVFVIQHDAAMPDSFGITLTCSRPAADGSRLTFGKFETAPNVEALARQDILFTGLGTLDPTRNGFFTTTAVYQPKFVTLKITSMDSQEVNGTLSGEFYRFSLATPSAKPTVLKGEGTFAAALIKK
jgi:hypothetical protein